MKILGMISVVALAGCAGVPDAASVGPKPANWQEITRAHVRATFFDPYSVRDAQIADPFPGGTVINHEMGSGYGWLVCLRANAKNRLGAYTGLKDFAIVIRDGRVVHQIEETAGMFCGGKFYRDFSI